MLLKKWEVSILMVGKSEALPKLNTTQIYFQMI